MDQADSLPDRVGDMADARWMTFTELAAVRGISKASAVKLVRRHKWRRQRDNQGHVLALVPPTWAEPEREGQADSPAADPRDSQGDNFRTINAFEAALTALREQADRERERADRAEARAEKLRHRFEELQGQIEARGEALQAELAAAHADRRAAEARTDAAGQRADHAELALAGESTRAESLRERADALTEQAEQAERRAQKAVEALAALNGQETLRLSRGLVARLVAAWRGQ